MVQESTALPLSTRPMKTTRFRVEISLVILVPFILGGVAVLPLLVVETFWPRLFTLHQVDTLGVLSGGAVYLAATGLLVWVRRPIRRFLETTRDMSVLPRVVLPARIRGDGLEQLEGVFDQIVEVLGAMDARALFPDMVGESRVLRGMFSQILKVAPTESTVLLLGGIGDGQGTGRAQSAREEFPGQGAVRGGQLRGHTGGAAGKRVVRP